ncbi:hypothetical protein [Kitasatospora sp. MBT63]|uniref:hypothetical protein n=1 Tax=Kitasatospora sp. MBT63 TaxID=1444768 RepID=UPI00053AA818|nr:hypothetical protein [Kitasatospora sp. MBT63]
MITPQQWKIYEDAGFRGHTFQDGALGRTRFRSLRPAPSRTGDVNYGPEQGFDWNDSISSVRA